MANLFRIVLVLGLIGTSSLANAQKKHALLIAINDYYEAKGKRSSESLNGPINDARAIKNLLIAKFGFSNQLIDTVYNENATRDNIIAAIKKKIRESKPGDQMFFYYSGHGVWMSNSELKDDSIKRGMSQALLTSDMYSYTEGFKCFIRDKTLKLYFNQFIDKKVTLTSVFDCCFSGNLTMVPRDPAITYMKEKSIDINDFFINLSSDPQKMVDTISGRHFVQAPGCALDANGQIQDKTDTDGDGVPDCKDREPATDKDCFPANTDGVGNCSLEYSLQKTLEKYDEAEMKDMETTRAAVFNGRQSITLNEADGSLRPTDRSNSKFLFLGASEYYQKGLEFANEEKIVHGLFTAAILRIYKKYPASLPVEELFKLIQADMAGFKVKQNPVIKADLSRKKANLVGARR